jgi:hypothetical protein
MKVAGNVWDIWKLTKFAGESTGCSEKCLLKVGGGSTGYFKNYSIKLVEENTDFSV